MPLHGLRTNIDVLQGADLNLSHDPKEKGAQHRHPDRGWGVVEA